MDSQKHVVISSRAYLQVGGSGNYSVDLSFTSQQHGLLLLQPP